MGETAQRCVAAEARRAGTQGDEGMGKRLRKKALLAEIQAERAALDETLSLLGRRDMTVPGVTRGGWSVQDVLAHLVEWQKMNLGWYAAGLRGERPAMPAPGFTLRELPRLNALIHRKHHGRSLQAVLRDYRSYHQRVVALINALPDTDLVTLERFSWTGPSWTLSDYLRACTAAHYLWARTRIRRWWRRQSSRRRPVAAGGAAVALLDAADDVRARPRRRGPRS
jgi:hypothetical protein